jgi:hypothetical protein
VAAGHRRKYANESLARIKRCFKWCVHIELVPVTIFQALLTVPGLARGKTTAVDHPSVEPAEVFEVTHRNMPQCLTDQLRRRLLCAFGLLPWRSPRSRQID